MIFRRMDLRMLEEGLDHVIADAQEYLEIRADDEAVCRWADETIEQAQLLIEKINIVIENMDKLANKGCNADVIFTPSRDD